jgi:hypothetical protein
LELDFEVKVDFKGVGLDIQDSISSLSESEEVDNDDKDEKELLELPL